MLHPNTFCSHFEGMIVEKPQIFRNSDEHGIGVNGVPQDDVVDLQLERIEVRLIHLLKVG